MMKRTNLLPALFLLFLSSLGAQEADIPTYVYRLQAREAEELYRRGEEALSDALFLCPIDTFAAMPPAGQSWPPGHYLWVTAQQEHLALHLHSVYSHQVISLNDGHSLRLRLADKAGHAVAEAQPLLDGRRIPYDRATEAYVLKRWNKGGFLRIELPGDTLFYALERDFERSLLTRRWQYFRKSQTGYVITTPIRLGERGYRFFKRGFGYGDWGRTRRHKQQASLKGYLALNKPRYQPGDTLKLAAYVAKANGKPWRKELNLYLYDPRTRQSHHRITLRPDTPGVVVQQWLLADSLTLDRDYLLVVEVPGEKQGGRLQQAFRYEDYQLREATYSLQAAADRFSGTEPMILLAEGRDYNGLQLMDAEVKIVLLSGRIIDCYASPLLIPDTLWVYQTELQPDGPTQIAVPDSVLPYCTATLQAHAFFADSKGELHEKRVSLDYNRRPLELRLRLEQDSLLAEALSEGQPLAMTARLYTNLPGQLQDAKGVAVNLPWRQAINPYVAEYQLAAGKQTVSARLSSGGAFSAAVQLAAQLRGDTLRLQIQNPRRLKLYWQVQSRQGEWAAGYTADSAFSAVMPGAGGEAYFVQCHYVWGGLPQIAKAEALYYKKLLNIELEQPEKVYPGQTETIKIVAKDYRQRPVSGVHLAAGAINAQFEQTRSFKAPDIAYRPPRAPMIYNRFQTNPYTSRVLSSSLDTAWYRRLGLGEQLFYRLRFPEKGSFWQYDSLAADTALRELALFAPYVVKQGRAQPIYLIYCNRELVYYYGTDDKPPYSFAGRAGYNRITFRTREREYQIDSVLLKPGWKLEFSIDEDFFVQSEQRNNISVRAMPPVLTEGEKKLLEQYFFVLRNPQGGHYNYLWDEQGRISRFRGVGRFLKLGPFRPNSLLHYQIQGGFYTSFQYEPGFSYQLFPQRERLYELHLFTDKQKVELPKTLPLQGPGQLPLLARDIERRVQEKTKLKIEYGHDQAQRGLGRYRFHYASEGDSMALSLIVLKKNDTLRTLYHSSTRTFSKLQPGVYRLVLFARNGTSHQRDIHISTDALRFEDLSVAVFELDTAVWYILGWSAELPAASLPSPYQHKGRLISGRILDKETGEPLIGANIHLSGTLYGTTTNLDGYYELWVPNGPYELSISYVGYASQKVNGYGAYGSGDILLSTSGLMLEEVMVLGYDEIRNLPTRNINAIAAVTAGSSLGLDDAITIRGSRELSTHYYTDGIRVSSDTMDTGDFLESAGGGRVRTLFRDDAWWQPHLLTGREGEAYFRVTYPDNITAWQIFAVGQDQRLRGGVGLGKVRAYQPLAAQLALPRFLIADDQAEVVGKATNYTGDTLLLRTYFEQDGRRVQENTLALAAGHSEKLLLEAPADADSLQLVYALEMDGFTDGERRSIPIFPRGTREAIGQFLLLEGDTTLELQFDPRYGEAVFYAQDNLLASLLEEADKLAGYPYGCNEQLASRLIALLLQKDIRRVFGEPFQGEEEIKTILAQLHQRQHPAGYWGWWPQGAHSNWITLHVLRALQQAQQSGYPSTALEKGLRFLTSQLQGMAGADLLEALMLCSESGQQLDYERFAERLDTLPLPLLHRLQLIRLRQENGLPYTLDSLYHYRQQSLLGGHFWGQPARHLRYNTTQPSLEAYRILRREGDSDGMRAIRQYFLETREASGICAWRNTYETAAVLATLLPAILEGEQGRQELSSRLYLSGVGEEGIGGFPYRATFSSEQPLRLSKSGAGPLFATVYQQFQNRSPKPKTDVFRLHTYLEQDGRRVERLRQGEKALLIAELEVDAHADYVAVEIPIPAGCSYFAKPSIHNSYEAHREYFRQHVAVFCEALPPGKHVFRIELEPRFTGRYALNPARAELMYFPVFYGRNALKEVVVE
jgi:alpha-2-macroglobulin